MGYLLTYILTKALGEKLVINADQVSDDTRFVCIRGGNVLGTNGSIVPLFKSKILEQQNIPITSSQMTRFFLTVSDAIQLLITAALRSIGGEIFVMKMRSCKIIDLANVMVENLSKNRIVLEEIGIRPGEKVHEVLISEHEALNTYEYNKNYYVILPGNPSPILQQQYNNLPKATFKRYESSYDQMTKEIKSLLVQGGFLH